MKRTIVALAALGMLAAAGVRPRAEQFGNIDLYGQYIETFQGPTTGLNSRLVAPTFDGISSPRPGGSECFIVNGSGASLQVFCSKNTGLEIAAPTYNINSDGTGTIKGTVTAGTPGSCPGAIPFNEKVVIQQLVYSPYVAAVNAPFVRTDLGYVASGKSCPANRWTIQQHLDYG